MKVYIGDVVTVVWSNGAGESDYRVVENEIGPSTFELVAEREFGEGVDDGVSAPFFIFHDQTGKLATHAAELMTG